jgi:hypothetical protein
MDLKNPTWSRTVSLDLLSCLYYSDRVIKLAKVVKPFNNMDLVSHILRVAPRHRKNLYELTEVTVSQRIQKLLETLERIEKAYPTDKECDGSHGNAKS